MYKKSLLNTNPYLKNRKLRAGMIVRSVTTSTAIEGVHIKENEIKTITKKRKK